jgi:hypothetical protein
VLLSSRTSIVVALNFVAEKKDFPVFVSFLILFACPTKTVSDGFPAKNADNLNALNTRVTRLGDFSPVR